MPDSHQPFDPDGGLIFATRLPGAPGGLDRSLSDWSALAAAGPEPLWIHLDRSRPGAQKWLRGQAELPRLVAETMLADETRPHAQRFGDGLLVVLRGVNMNPGAEPDELIALRIWAEPHRIITARLHRFQTIAKLRELAVEGLAPATPGALLAAIAQGLSARMGPTVVNLEEMVDEIEEGLVDDDRGDEIAWRRQLATIRRQSIAYRRYLVPQRDALLELSRHPGALFDDVDRADMQVSAGQVTRITESLEEMRDRAAVTQEELRSRHEARLGRTLYLLTIVATIALPLSFATGLLGINVGGIPLASSDWGFVIVCVVLAALGVVEVVLFRVLRWL